MSKFRHALQNRDQHILTLRMICGVLVLCLFVAFAGWMRAPAKLTIHNPPDLRSGSTGHGGKCRCRRCTLSAFIFFSN